MLGGRYRIVRPLGSGGAGAVYEAREEAQGRAVALKILHQELAADAVQLGRFRREARAAAAIGHPNIAQLLDFADARAGEPAFLVLELVPGRSLVEIITRQPILPPARAVALATQILAALEAAHAAGVVHRDLKPGNVVVADGAAGEIAKLVDFGIAQIHESASYQRLTRTGVIVGTPRYMSPEQASGGQIDGRTDLWALGVILYRMLSGSFPFDGRADQIIVQIMKQDPPPFARELGVPPALEAVVRRALEKKSAARWPTALAMSSALRAAMGEIPATAEARLPARREEAKTQALPMRISVQDLGTIPAPDRTIEEARSSFADPTVPSSGGATAVMVSTPSAAPPAPYGRASSASLAPGVPAGQRSSVSGPRVAMTAGASSSGPHARMSGASGPARTPGTRLALIVAGVLVLVLVITGCLVAPSIGAAVGLWSWSHGGCVGQGR